MSAIDTITRDALMLSPDERLVLANKLFTSVEPDEETDLAAEEEWDAVIRERIRRYDAGEAKTIPAAEAFARLRREFAEK